MTRKTLMIFTVMAVFCLTLLGCSSEKKTKTEPQHSSSGTKLFCQGLAPARKDDLWGYINKDGEFEIKPQFSGAGLFSESGFALVRNEEGDSYLINTKGEPLETEYVPMSSFFDNGPALVIKNEKYSFMNEKGEIVTELEFDDIDGYADKSIAHINCFSNGLAAVCKDDKWGYIDEKGKLEIDFQYDKAKAFSENGLAPVKMGDKWGYIDRSGNVIIEAKYDEARTFSDNDLANVMVGDECFYINKNDEMVIKTDEFIVGQTDFEQGLAGIIKGDKCGFMNENGNIVIEPQYDSLGGYTAFLDNGLAEVKVDEKCGVINLKGEYVVEPKYDVINIFVDYIVFSQNEKYGVMDLNGNIILDAEYKELATSIYTTSPYYIQTY